MKVHLYLDVEKSNKLLPLDGHDMISSLLTQLSPSVQLELPPWAKVPGDFFVDNKFVYWYTLAIRAT